ncbi:Alkaline ceramidase 1 [Fukomys damarensis]|uniref:Alkaline ceramidase n=1 Tax=Fukomys damarensis TaxID=885580 RepID=A0A091D9K5_FUKDA|nr:Alkaline ceramidase 1 [Fukomys damarensis]
MKSILAYQSSEVDWCESNFQHSPLVAEFYNTFSNITFLIFGPLMAFLLQSYIERRTRYIYCTLAQRIATTARTCNKQLRHMIQMSVVLWATALASWISDHLFCSFWQRIHFFYLHSIWHVLMSITFPYGMVALALMDAKYEMPGQALKVRYWPRDSWPVGLPYVEIQADDKSC